MSPERVRRAPLFRLPTLVLGFVLVLAACHVRPADTPPAERAVVSSLSVAPAATDSAFVRLVAQLSEPGGYFDTDNLISNERSYLHVLGALREHGVTGGAYLGVGPDQNFSYIAQIRPEIAFLVDIRRDNLLQHVFYKALFAEARHRIDFLLLLFGKAVRQDAKDGTDLTIEELAAYVDATPAVPESAEAARAAVQAAVRRSGLPLADEDLAYIDNVHRRFIEAGLGLRFNSHHRAPRPYYPTYRDLLLEKDRTGHFGNYLAREDDFQFLKAMHARNRIIPVIGDLAGTHALRAIGTYLSARHLTVSALYTSNVEFYLMRQGRFPAFAENIRALPWDDRSVLIRSYFNRWTTSHPETVPGYASTQLLQPIARFVAVHENGGYQSYWELINEGGE